MKQVILTEKKWEYWVMVTVCMSAITSSAKATTLTKWSPQNEQSGHRDIVPYAWKAELRQVDAFINRWNTSQKMSGLMIASHDLPGF